MYMSLQVCWLCSVTHLHFVFRDVQDPGGGHSSNSEGNCQEAQVFPLSPCMKQQAANLITCPRTYNNGPNRCLSSPGSIV